jgi:hypothetical protein
MTESGRDEEGGGEAPGSLDDGAEPVLGVRIPARIELAAGESYRLALPSAAGGGYTWEATPAGGDPGASRVELEVGPVPPQGEQPTSALAPVTLIAAGLSPGRAVWRLRLVRVWQPARPLVDRLLEVVVR